MSHPGGAVAYRIDHDGRRIVYATDHEPGNETIDRALSEFARDAQYLILDATYLPAEYESLRRGWGHGSWLSAVQASCAAGAETLILFHHHPDYADDHLDEVERLARERFPATFVAREGMLLTF